MVKHRLKLRRLSTTEAYNLLKAFNEEDLRDIDIEELKDATRKQIIPPEDFHTILCSGIGLLDPECSIIHTEYDGGSTAFIATSFRHPTQAGVNLLCGFGLKKADSVLGKRERLQIAAEGTKLLLLGDTGCQSWVCYVRENNLDTIKSWKLIQKIFQTELEITFIPHPVKDVPYIMVRTNRRKP